MKKIVIASGKGGTGKTTVAINLAHYLGQVQSQKVNLLDCDVEAPNANLFIKAKFEQVADVKVERPTWIKEKCNACGKCSQVCNFNAIAKANDQILIFDELCHSCNACIHLCPNKALQKTPKAIGKVEFAPSMTPFTFGHGLLNIGENLAPKVIHELKEFMMDDAINIIDAPPGTTCPVVKAMEGMDYCLLVTEPTPFGLSDLRLAAEVAAQLNLPTGIVINRSFEEDHLIEQFAKDHNIPIIGKIPFEEKYAKAYSSGKILINEFPELQTIFSEIYNNLQSINQIPQIKSFKYKSSSRQEYAPDDQGKTSKYKEMVVISGKGGTGKTTLMSCLSELIEDKIITDCDVDAANLHLILNPTILSDAKFIGGKKFSIEPKKCTSCGACYNLCNFNAISLNTNNGSSTYTVNEMLCEGCGFCFELCKAKAISSYDDIAGTTFLSETSNGILSHAKLEAGKENSGKLVSLVRQKASEMATQHNKNKIISDGPPGTGCPVISSITGVNLALIVTEPTVSGVHDMKRALELTTHFRIPSLIIINKFDLNMERTQEIQQIAEVTNSPVIGKIPFDKQVYDALMQQKSIMSYKESSAYQAIIQIGKEIKRRIK